MSACRGRYQSNPNPWTQNVRSSHAPTPCAIRKKEETRQPQKTFCSSFVDCDNHILCVCVGELLSRSESFSCQIHVYRIVDRVFQSQINVLDEIRNTESELGLRSSLFSLPWSPSNARVWRASAVSLRPGPEGGVPVAMVPEMLLSRHTRRMTKRRPKVVYRV